MTIRALNTVLSPEYTNYIIGVNLVTLEHTVTGNVMIISWLKSADIPDVGLYVLLGGL